MSWDYIVTVPEFTGDKDAKIIRKTKTNADKIRAMSDEELATFFSTHGIMHHGVQRKIAQMRIHVFLAGSTG